MNKNIKLNYIVGLIQADGNFSISIGKKNDNIWLSLKFNLSLHKKNEDVIIAIKEYFNCGSYYIDNRGYCRFNVNKISDLINIIILFFIKYLLRGGKYESFIMFKVVIDKLYNREHYKYNTITKNTRYNLVLLKLINIAFNMNLLSKNRSIESRNNLLRYLNESERLIVESKSIFYEDIINEEYNKYFNKSLIDIDFIVGLFEGDGNITVYFTKNDINSLRIRMYFNIVQDLLNRSVLEEVYKYFNCGHIYDISSDNMSRYDVKSIVDMKEIIILQLINYNMELNIKLYKIKYINNIIKWLNENSNRIINKQDIIYIGNNLYYIINNDKNITKDKYIKDLLEKYEYIWNK